LSLNLKNVEFNTNLMTFKSSSLGIFVCGSIEFQSLFNKSITYPWEHLWKRRSHQETQNFNFPVYVHYLVSLRSQNYFYNYYMVQENLIVILFVNK